MGIADVIPGVSGGTLALILGVYRELIDTIKAVSPAPLVAAGHWLKNGRTSDDFDQLKHEIGKLNLLFLIPLFAGIVTAIGVGSIVIPPLLSDYPEAMRAFFFGLILASVAAPFRMIEEKGAKVTIVVGVIIGIGVGYVATDPGRQISISKTAVSVTSEGETLKSITRRGPSAKSAADVFWSDDNQPLRDAVKADNPALFAELEAVEKQDPKLNSKDAQKKRSEPYDTISVPKGTPVNVPRLAHWFVFLAGLIAICAMILPGISGSYLLLILNAYFFVLNALKGTIETLASGAIPTTQLGFVIVFCFGCLIGILSFARLLSFLLREHGAITLSVLVGLMIGCLRGVWPFRDVAGNSVINVLPSADHPALFLSIGTSIVGFIIVVAFTYFGRKREAVPG